MTAQAAFADAGVELCTAGVPDEVSLDGTGEDLVWSDAELHAAMVSHFSLHRDTRQWKLWGFIANRHTSPTTDSGVDNITLNETVRRLARAHARAGDLKEADTVLDQLVETFRDKDVPAPVLDTIVEQAEATRTQLHDQP
ncbi:hypothetical protein AB0G15_19780 [Streptosporangium sp. NPDC023825]|uniref:hypothetical protein n=1 Tax=Streptosporangium sp. NPDC023825 TaxID=3154909 RepID=UPI00343BCF79